MKEIDFVVKRGRKRIPVVFADLPSGEYGACEAPGTKNRRILIQKGLGDAKFLQTLLHEMIHWQFDFLEESYVENLELWLKAAIDCAAEAVME